MEENTTQPTTETPAMTPATIATTVPVAQHMAEYQAILNDEVAAKRAKLEAEAKIKAVANKLPGQYISTSSDAKNIKVYKPMPEVEEAKKVADEFEDQLSEIFSTDYHERADRKMLEDYLGPDAWAKLVKLDELANEESAGKEVDEEATQKVQTEFTEAQEAYLKACNDLDSLRTRRENAKELVSYVRDLAQIAQASK
jgi:hypothetical protein